MAETYAAGDRVAYDGKPATVLHASLSRVFIQLDPDEATPAHCRTRRSVKASNLRRLDEAPAVEGHA